MSDSEESDISQDYIISLHNLPVEIFLCICSFLNATTLHNKLRLVCKRFYDILSDESYWSIWMKRRWPLLKTPALEISNEDKKVSLRSVYYHIDKELYLWCENGKRTRNIELKNFHIAEVDAVKLIQNGDIVITGSRDRNIALWKVHEDSTQPFKYKANAHLGWVWDMAIESGNRFYSGSWDSMIKLWDIEAELVQVSGFK
uniref:F-box domain-containing protein n=2 Tax=Clastoptera arizonana TaxID=38151 RepID=A0A1B6CZ55_9HEMI